LAGQRQEVLLAYEASKAWLEEQVRSWQQVAGQRQEALAAYEAGKAWLEEQVRNWQQVAGQRQEALVAYETGKARLEEQVRSWQQTSEEQRLRFAELESRKLALEGQLEDLARLEQELSRWQQIASEAQESLARLESRANNLRAELEYWRQSAEERDRWIAELEKAKTWLAQHGDNWEAAAEQRSERIVVLEETIARMRATRAWRTAEWSVGVLRRISGICRGIVLLGSPRLVSSNAKNFLLGLRLVFGGGEGRAIWGAHFDAGYYNWAHPDVARSGIHPGLHYLLCGYFENRNPSWSFDSVYYRSRYSDVRDAGINPLLHYAVFGHREERSMAPPLKPAAANLPSPAPLVAQPHRAPFATETAPPLEDVEGVEDSEALLAGTGAAMIERLEVPESPRDTGSPGNDTQHALVMGHEFKPDFSNTPVSELRPRFGYAPADPGAPPAVSLVTPFFNVGSIFNETAESVFRQSLQQWEWIIVDDCSDSPESAEILRVYANKDPRVRVLRSEQRNGPAAARNLGVQAARAAYVAFLDGDDLFEPTALEKWLWFLDCHPQHAMVKGFQAGFGTQGYIWREGFHSGAAILERNLIQTACMMRREIYLSVGGMDEKIRGGMEDWEFWLRCADAGHWGGTVPEVLDWYRRRASHNDRWEDWDDADRQAAFRDELRSRHPRLFAGGFPEPALSFPQPYIELPAQLKFENRLSRGPGTQRVLMIVPHLALGGSDQVTLDVISALVAKHDCEVTVATTLPGTHAWRHRFEALTPDVFTLDTFLRLRDYPRFLAYLIRSRNIDSVLVTHSQMGYQLLPYLRAECPGLRCYDYVHIEEPHWKQGGYPAYSIAYRSFLDRTAASSRHLKDWMIGRGGDADKISVVTTNVDIEDWRRDQFDASALRRKWDVPEALPVILFVGRLCEQKQPHVLAATARALHDRGVRFICLVAGDGEQRPWLERFVSQHQLTEVRLVGSRSLEEIRELLALSDIFFLPSRHEGISQALYEAMAMEAVPVGADVGGQKELVPPSCGILIPPGGDEAANYADALASLLTDGRRRAAMARAARERVVAHFQLPDMGRKMNEILRGQRDTSVFDLDRAFRTFVPTHAREIIEQRRAESIADQCWLQHRGLALAPPAALDTAAALDTPDAPGSRRPDGFAQSALRVLAILHPLFAGKAHRRNRKVLLQILGRPRSRRELLAAFDRDFYCCTNSDIPQISPLPLLHYIFFGYREGRLPSPDFESEMFLRAHPDPSAGKTNPLLWKVLLRGQKHAAQQTEE
jgi:glycosyltransferase involved in cell wall biosynthesis